MVAVDSTASPVHPKRIGKGANHRRNRHNRLRKKSTRLVKTGKIDLAPCLVCGSEQDLTIHHVGPMQADRFVFLCEACHILAHKPVLRTMDVCVASGEFSIRPEAVLPRKEVACG